MTQSHIRLFHDSDLTHVEEITYKTGDFGRDLTGKNYFNDSRLFFYLYIFDYTVFQPEHFFVIGSGNRSEDGLDDLPVGFICGTPDSENYQKKVNQNKQIRPFLRAWFVSSWKHPESFREYRSVLCNREKTMKSQFMQKIRQEYPAHLHINLLPGFQTAGMGSKLMTHYLSHLKNQGADGVHLATTSLNEKAVPFYQKHGFEVKQEHKIWNHRNRGDFKILTLARKL